MFCSFVTRTKSFFRFFSVVVLLTQPATLFAGRPLVVDDATPVDSGRLEFELGIQQARPHGGGRDQAWPIMTWTYGAIDNLDMGLSIQRVNQDYPGVASLRGFQDLHLKAKYRVIPEQMLIPATALALDIKFPTASRSKGLTNGDFNESVLLILSKTWMSFAIHFNAGYLFAQSSSAHRSSNDDVIDQIQGGIACEWLLHSAWTLVAEIFGESRENRRDKNSATFHAGVRYAVTPALVFDAAAGRSLRTDGSQIQGTLGLTWTLDLSGLTR